MRGTAPLLVALISVLVLGDHLSWLAWSGIGVICLSILAMAMNGRMQSRKDLAGAAERLFYRRVYPGGRHRCATLGHCAGLYALDLLHERFLPAELGNGGAASRSVQLPAPALEKGLLGGVGTMGSYGLALWAMTQAPLAVVAALRETSILFGALIAFVLLKRRLPACASRRHWVLLPVRSCCAWRNSLATLVADLVYKSCLHVFCHSSQ